MTNNIIEKAAKAVMQYQEGGSEPMVEDMWKHTFPSHKNKLREEAREVLQTIHDNPSPEMIKAAVEFAQSISLSGDYTWPDYMKDLFQIMIKEALND